MSLLLLGFRIPYSVPAGGAYYAIANEDYGLREADGRGGRLVEAGDLRGKDRGGRADELDHAVVIIVDRPDVAGGVDGDAKWAVEVGAGRSEDAGQLPARS